MINFLLLSSITERSNKYPVTVVSDDFKLIKQCFGVPVYCHDSNHHLRHGCEGILFKCYSETEILGLKSEFYAELGCDGPERTKLGVDLIQQ